MHRLGPYLLLTRIGVGGMAEIFLARKGSQVVALKRILPHLAAHDDFVDMFVDEARLAARLQHPNIARVLDVGREDGLWYIAMEYVPGEDLLTIIRRAREKHMPTPLGVGASIIADAAAALHHAHESRDEEGHSLGLVHRDVTPSNLIVSHEGEVKLVDFGIAKAERRVSVTAAGALKGKYAYMAPEHALGETLDRRADVFSLGVVAWETFTQRRLFHRDHELAVLRAVTEERIPIPSERRGDLPGELDEIIMRALDRDRETRWPTARHMEQALRRFVSSRLEGPPSHAIADLMDSLFGVTVAEKRRRWAAGDLDEEPSTQVEPFGTPPPTQPRSRVPDLDADSDQDHEHGDEDATRIADEPGTRRDDPTERTQVDADLDDLDPKTTVVPLRPRNGATLPLPTEDATRRDVRVPVHLPSPARPPELALPRVSASRPAFPRRREEEYLVTEPVPRLEPSRTPRWLRPAAIGAVVAVTALVLVVIVRGPDDRGAPARPPRLAGSAPATSGSSVPAALEAPQLGGAERKVVGPVERPGVEGPPDTRLGFDGPPGAIITLDGQRLGVLPLEPRSVPAGPHSVTITGPGGVYTRTFAVDVGEGRTHVEVIRIDPATGEVVHHPAAPP